MPFNGSGTFTIVNTFIPNTTILSSAVNANFSDIAIGLSDCLTRDGQAGMTAAIKAVTGSAGAPSITFTSDTQTGMYLISSGNLGFSSNGVAAASINQFQVVQLQQAALAKLWCVVDTADASTSSNINTLATASTGLINIGTSTNWATNGYVLAGNEVMSYTLTSANGLTVNTRGDMGTTSVSHATGSAIAFLYTSVAQSTLLLPARATAARSTSPVRGEIGFNTGSSLFEGYNGVGWTNLTMSSIPPQGYLSPVAGTPISNSDLVSQTSIFYNPFSGNQLPIPTNGIFSLETFSTSQIALSASQTTGGIYDIYGFICTTNNTLTFGVSPSWAAGTAGSVGPGAGQRGIGTGGTALTRLNGFFVNGEDMTILNGASSYSMAINSGIYLGSIYIGATAGTVNLHRTWGQNREWGIWNAFNRVPVYLKAGDSTASWTYATAAFRPSNGSTANSLNTFVGLTEEITTITFEQSVLINTSTASSTSKIQLGIGVNSTSTPIGLLGTLNYVVNSVVASFNTTIVARSLEAPSIGLNTITSLENTLNPGAGTTTYFGTEGNMILSALWRA